MKLLVLVPLCALLSLTQQAPSNNKCTCQLTNSEKAFPHSTLLQVNDGASKCNSDVPPRLAVEMESLMLGLKHRLPQLQEDVSILEKEDDGNLYGVLSLYVIENELLEIRQLMAKLNSTTIAHQHLTNVTTETLNDLQETMQKLESYDSMQVVKRQKENQLLSGQLQKCRRDGHGHLRVRPTEPPAGNCPHGHLSNITGPGWFTAGEYPGSYKYGAWGRDPKPAEGKENWYWMVPLTSGNKFSNYVRLYSSLSFLFVGKSIPGNILIHSSNPTTNTIQGPNVVLYGDALYYNCYNQDAVCRFNLTTKAVTNAQLPKGTRFNSKSNFCQLDECYPFTDLDLATDESGVWVIYTTNQDFGNLVLSKVEEGQPPVLGQTWHTSVFKQSVTNTFMVCGVLYATRYISREVEEVFYSFDTTTGAEKFNIGIFISKMSPNIYSLNYSPVDRMLYAYCDSNLVSYKVLFS